MAAWLFKADPDDYAYHDLERDGETTWDGATNALALQNLRKVREGDRIWFYHTGNEKAVVGEMVALTGPFPEPGNDDGKIVVVKVGPVRRLARPVTLAEIKADESFAEWDLVKNSRLSVMPVSTKQWRRVEQLSRRVDE